MSLRALFLLLVAALLGLFAVLNWQAFMAPTTLSLLFTSIQAPLGLVMLLIAGLLTAVFLLYVVYLQTTVIMEARRCARELQTQRKLTDDAEASRLAELRGAVEDGFRKLEENVAQSRAGVQTRLDQLSTDMRLTIEQSGTVLTAYIGEVEDRLEQRIASKNPVPTP